MTGNEIEIGVGLKEDQARAQKASKAHCPGNVCAVHVNLRRLGYNGQVLLQR